jgi:hypothetical protein
VAHPAIRGRAVVVTLATPDGASASADGWLRDFTPAERLTRLQIHCPKCAAVNRVGGGLGLRHIDEPIDRMCEGCRRGLTLRIESSSRD